MLERIKYNLGISHSLLDTEINNQIKSAQAELLRLGVNEKKTSTTDDTLIQEAIISYVCAKRSIGDAILYKTYWDGFLYQADNLRKSKGYAR